MSEQKRENIQRRQEDTELTATNIQDAKHRRRQKSRTEQRELVELLTEKDLESVLNEKSYKLLENLISKTFPLANFGDDQVHEYIHRMWVARRKFYDMHPGPDDVVKGPVRAWVHGNKDAYLKPLTQQQRFAVDTVFKNAEAAITPAEDFAQQEMFSTSISESHIVRGDGDSDEGILGRVVK
jgi:hypothetical protein